MSVFIENTDQQTYDNGQIAKQIAGSDSVRKSMEHYREIYPYWDKITWPQLGKIIGWSRAQQYAALGWTPDETIYYLGGKQVVIPRQTAEELQQATATQQPVKTTVQPTQSVNKTLRPAVVTKTVPSTYKNKITIKDGTLYGSFPGYSQDQIIKAITGLSKSNTNNQNVSYSWEREQTTSEPANSNQSQQFTKIGGFKSKPIPTEKGVMSDEAAFMYRYPRKKVDVYNIQSPEAYDKIMAELKKIKGEGADLAEGEYVFSTKELPITTANDSTFHVIYEPKEGVSGYPNTFIIDNKYLHFAPHKDFTTSVALGEILPKGETTNLIYPAYTPDKEWEKKFIRKVPNTNNLYEYRSQSTDHKVWRDKVTSGNYDKYYIDKYGEVPPHVDKFETANNGIITAPHVYYLGGAEGDQRVKLSDFTDTHSWSTQEPKQKNTFIPQSVKDSAQQAVDSTKQVVNTAKEKVKQGVSKVRSWLGFKQGGSINYLKFFNNGSIIGS